MVRMWRDKCSCLPRSSGRRSDGGSRGGPRSFTVPGETPTWAFSLNICETFADLRREPPSPSCGGGSCTYLATFAPLFTLSAAGPLLLLPLCVINRGHVHHCPRAIVLRYLCLAATQTTCSGHYRTLARLCPSQNGIFIVYYRYLDIIIDINIARHYTIERTRQTLLG